MGFVCLYRGGGAIPLVERWRYEHNNYVHIIIMNKLVEQERFIDSVTVKSAMLKDNFLIKGFMAFCVSPV